MCTVSERALCTSDLLVRSRRSRASASYRILQRSPPTLENLIGVSSDGALSYFRLRFSMVYENRNYIKVFHLLVILWDFMFDVIGLPWNAVPLSIIRLLLFSLMRGRQPYRPDDLQDRLDRERHSPQRRYSPVRDARGGRAFHGYNPPRSDVRRSDRKFGKRQHDGQSDVSGSLRASDGTDDRGKEEKLASSRSKDLLRDQIKEMKLDVDLLNDNKQQLEVELKERSQEVDSLSYRIQELESQLSEEKEIFKRITSRIKKFIKAHSSYTRLQNESQARLDKLVDDFSFNITQLVRNEEDTNNIVGDVGTVTNHLADRLAEPKDQTSPAKKKFYFNMNVEGSKSAKVSKGGHATGHHETSHGNAQDIDVNGDMETLPIKNKKRAIDKILDNEGKAKRRKDFLKGLSSSDKMKGIHATDDFELFKSEDKSEPKEDAFRADQNGIASDVVSFPLPPPLPPPINKDNYLQYKGDDEQVEVDGQEEDLVEVDIV
ncbi:Zinc finger CCCH domain-containing protein [Drosera capensis]